MQWCFMADNSSIPGYYVRRELKANQTSLLEPGHAIVLKPEMISMVIDAVQLARNLAHAALKESGTPTDSVDGTRLDAVLGALILDLHALDNGTHSYGLQPNPSKRRIDGGSLQPEHNHPLDILLREEAVAAYELLQKMGLKSPEAMRFVSRAINKKLGRSTLLNHRKAMADEGRLDQVVTWFTGMVVKVPLPGSAPPHPDWMSMSSIKNRIADQLKFTAERHSEL
jgi:hypothetical protein